jgi:hypothetical protein
MMVSRSLVMARRFLMVSAPTRFRAFSADFFVELVSVASSRRFATRTSCLGVLLCTATSSLHDSPFVD